MSSNLVTLRRKREGGGIAASVLDRLRTTMDRERVVDPQAIARIARESGIPEAAVHGVATYYGDLSTTPRGDVRVQVCVGTACVASCGETHVRSLEDALGVELGQTRGDRAFSLEPVYCLGLCDAAPSVLVDRHDGGHLRTVLGRVGPDVAAAIARGEIPDAPEPRPRIAAFQTAPIVLRNLIDGDAATLDRAVARGVWSAWRSIGTRSPASILEEIATSVLRGRGGAGFSTAQKWRFAAAQPPGEKWIVCNADEGDPGSFIDKWLLELDPHSILEGMAIAGHAIGAARGVVYVRSEYPRAIEVVRRAIDDARRADLLGARFDVDLVEGAGAYVCGEETALLRSIEGLRGMVTARPPYPAEKGLFGKPTVVNNVETLVNVPWILAHGGAAFAAIGHGNSRGTKAISLADRFARPGLYEIPLGIPLRTIVEELGGGGATRPIKAVQIGGPLGGLVPAHLFDVPFAFEELDAIGALLGHGGIVAFEEGTDMRAIARHLFAFGDDESCGKCFPCRIGMRRGRELIGKMQRSGGRPAQIELLGDLLETMRHGSLCAHGGGLPAAIESIAKHWPEELLAEGVER